MLTNKTIGWSFPYKWSNICQRSFLSTPQNGCATHVFCLIFPLFSQKADRKRVWTSVYIFQGLRKFRKSRGIRSNVEGIISFLSRDRVNLSTKILEAMTPLAITAPTALCSGQGGANFYEGSRSTTYC